MSIHCALWLSLGWSETNVTLENNRQYWNFYNGLDVFIFDYANNIAYEEVPKVYERDCQGSPAKKNIKQDH